MLKGFTIDSKLMVVTSRMCMPLWSVLRASSPTRTSEKMEADLLWILRPHSSTRMLSCPGLYCWPSAPAATSETLHESKCRKTPFYALAPSWYWSFRRLWDLQLWYNLLPGLF